MAGHGKAKVEDKEKMIKEIRKEMKERSRLNRAKRYFRSEEEKKQREEEWNKQKSKVQSLIKIAMGGKE